MTNRHKIDDVRIAETLNLDSPATIIGEIPLTDEVANTVISARDAIEKILNGNDKRLLVVAGPCSIHDTAAAMEYAERLAGCAQQFSDTLMIVMRVYFEKPRTTVGWKGLINDPNLDETFDICKGLRLARQLLVDINRLGLPCAIEFLDVISPQYFAELISWGAIGARTTESQIHRELASGLSAPIGFKNGTDGNIKIAIDAICSSQRSHRFLSIKKDGSIAISRSNGNPCCHVILRGGNNQTNYSADDVAATAALLKKAGLPPNIMIDCSHANSAKDHNKQALVVESICEQIKSKAGRGNIMGVMIESNLVAGNQPLSDNLVYGQSITDACVSWETTVTFLEQLAAAVQTRL